MPFYECPACCGTLAPCVPCCFGALSCRRPTAQAFTLVTAGFVDAGGFLASKFNGSWRLDNNGFCEWSYSQASPSLCIFVRLDFVVSKWRIYFVDRADCSDATWCYIRYELDQFVFNCSGTNIMGTPTVKGGCGNPGRPATVTLVPFGTPCGACYPINLPATLIWSNPGGGFPAVTLTYDPATQSWKGTGPGHPTFCPAQPFNIEGYFCGDRFVVRANFTGFPADDCTSAQVVPTSCSPFLWQASSLCATCYSSAAAISNQVSQ